jgi:hypothetical protein
MWLMVFMSGLTWQVVQFHAAARVNQTFTEFVVGSWVAGFIGAAAKRGATQIASMKAECGDGQPQ